MACAHPALKPNHLFFPIKSPLGSPQSSHLAPDSLLSSFMSPVAEWMDKLTQLARRACGLLHVLDAIGCTEISPGAPLSWSHPHSILSRFRNASVLSKPLAQIPIRTSEAHPTFYFAEIIETRGLKLALTRLSINKCVLTSSHSSLLCCRIRGRRAGAEIVFPSGVSVWKLLLCIRPSFHNGCVCSKALHVFSFAGVLPDLRTLSVLPQHSHCFCGGQTSLTDTSIVLIPARHVGWSANLAEYLKQ